ncbi:MULTISPECIES: Hsp20/alpha crystallin family protein [unclassified Caballeronia]|uniref:Hsp20/alpha crystallin family protein n=1 Tax=unclassified Caballeronia TaxID=2646786 RepID=UPI003857BCB7
MDRQGAADHQRRARERTAGRRRRHAYLCAGAVHRRFPARHRMPQHADPDKVTAQYTNGCLTVSIGKRETSKPRAITVQ